MRGGRGGGRGRGRSAPSAGQDLIRETQMDLGMDKFGPEQVSSVLARFHTCPAARVECTNPQRHETYTPGINVPGICLYALIIITSGTLQHQYVETNFNVTQCSRRHQHHSRKQNWEMVKEGVYPPDFVVKRGIGKTRPREALPRAPNYPKFSRDALARCPWPLLSTHTFFFEPVVGADGTVAHARS